MDRDVSGRLLQRLQVGVDRHELDPWDLRPSHNWYDFIVTCAEARSFQRRLAGHAEDGKPSVSDPLLGRQA